MSASLIIFRNSFESSTVDVIVGEAETKFTVYKTVLSDIASFFKAALEGNFKESSEQKITMPEESPEVFRRFLLWAHSGSLLGHQEQVTDMSPELLARLYIFGDAHGIPHLQNSAIDSLVAWTSSERRTPVEISHLVYQKTTKDCALQRYLVERIANKGVIKKEWFEGENIQQYPAEFLADLVVALFAMKGTTSPVMKHSEWDEIGCRYHIHPPDNQETATSSDQNSENH